MSQLRLGKVGKLAQDHTAGWGGEYRAEICTQFNLLGFVQGSADLAWGHSPPAPSLRAGPPEQPRSLTRALPGAAGSPGPGLRGCHREGPSRSAQLTPVSGLLQQKFADACTFRSRSRAPENPSCAATSDGVSFMSLSQGCWGGAILSSQHNGAHLGAGTPTPTSHACCESQF